MIQNSSKFDKWVLVIILIAGWYALLAQLYLIIVNNPIPVQEAIIQYFSYFTILSNLMIALCLSFRLFRNKTNFLTNERTLTAIAVYIAVVGLIYNSILRFTWRPEGLQLIVDELLHAVMPILYLLYWFIFVPKTLLKWKHVFAWLIYPFVYLIFILVRGSLSGFYPYLFVDANKLGFDAVFLNCIYIVILFLILSLLLIWIGKISTEKKDIIRKTS